MKHATNLPISVEYCFNRKGRGRIIIRERSGGRKICEGEARAGFHGAELRIDADRSLCPDGERFSGQSTTCSGRGGQTRCTGRNKDSGIIYVAPFRRK